MPDPEFLTTTSSWPIMRELTVIPPLVPIIFSDRPYNSATVFVPALSGKTAVIQMIMFETKTRIGFRILKQENVYEGFRTSKVRIAGGPELSCNGTIFLRGTLRSANDCVHIHKTRATNIECSIEGILNSMRLFMEKHYKETGISIRRLSDKILIAEFTGVCI